MGIIVCNNFNSIQLCIYVFISLLQCSELIIVLYKLNLSGFIRRLRLKLKQQLCD